jgi:hypothetical protein
VVVQELGFEVGKIGVGPIALAKLGFRTLWVAYGLKSSVISIIIIIIITTSMRQNHMFYLVSI